MHPRTIERIGCFVPLAIIGLAGILWLTRYGDAAFLIFVASFVGSFVLAFLLYFVPARCQEPGCNGHVHRKWEPHRWVGHIIYTCHLCGAQYRGGGSWNTD